MCMTEKRVGQSTGQKNQKPKGDYRNMGWQELVSDMSWVGGCRNEGFGVMLGWRGAGRFGVMGEMLFGKKRFSQRQEA